MKKLLEDYVALKEEERILTDRIQTLRQQIIDRLGGPTEGVLSGFYIKLVQQEKYDYDDELLYGALPDKTLWIDLSVTDPAKVKKAVENGILQENNLIGTYKVKTHWWLQVKKAEPDKPRSKKR